MAEAHTREGGRIPPGHAADSGWHWERVRKACALPA